MGKIITVAGHKGGIGKKHRALFLMCMCHKERENSLFPGNRLTGKYQGFHRGS